jgi:DNA adenine methylase
MSGVVSRWLGSIEALPAVALRLLRVQIENRPAVEVIRLYDERSTLFYCDPPYVHSTRGDSKAYGFEMKDDEHVDLARVLKGVKGKAAVSGYRCDLMDRLYEGWKCIEAPPKTCHSIKKVRTEAVWQNY